MQVRDEDGLTDSITFSVIVRQNNAPTLASIGSKTVRVGQTLTINLDTVDTPAYYVGQALLEMVKQVDNQSYLRPCLLPERQTAHRSEPLHSFP